MARFSQSGQGPVGTFDVAVFKPGSAIEANTVVGEMLRCGYWLQSGGTLDMKFKSEGTVVSIEAVSPWEKWFAQYYYDNKEARACRFTEIVRPAKR